VAGQFSPGSSFAVASWHRVEELPSVEHDFESGKGY